MTKFDFCQLAILWKAHHRLVCMRRRSKFGTLQPSCEVWSFWKAPRTGQLCWLCRVMIIDFQSRKGTRERDTHTHTEREREREREKTVKCSAFRRAMEIENGLLYISESCYYWCAPVSDPCWGNLNCSRTMEGITIGFWVTIEGYLSYLLLKFEDLIPTSLGDIAI